MSIYIEYYHFIVIRDAGIYFEEVLGSNLLAAAVVPLDKALYPHCLVPRKGLKAVGLLVACL